MEVIEDYRITHLINYFNEVIPLSKPIRYPVSQNEDPPTVTLVPNIESQAKEYLYSQVLWGLKSVSQCALNYS